MVYHALELLAPAKNADIGIEAILHGADAVYIGGPGFGAREDAANTFAEINRLTDFAHRFNARVYMTLNTLVADEEMPQAVDLAWQAYKNGVDALIVQDMGLLEADLPPIQLHASTQCDVRTPEKARFLESLGFSQIVLARESNLDTVAKTHSLLRHARIEYFIHGALCVSYSGQCYASFAATGRSANRGACAQLCRLPYSVYTEDGKLLAKDKHVLSLRDNNQSENLEALIEAGVSSFKIEGRLKDVQYVKNVTAYYRQKLDEIIARHSGLKRSSDGTSFITFEPDLKKSFNRGFTDYFTRERHHDMVALDTPKDAGIPIGKIVRVNADSLEISSLDELHNGDGFTYLTRENTLSGFAINRAESLTHNLWRLTLREKPIYRKHPQLKPGMTLFRNHDRHWEDALTKATAKRLIPISMEWTATARGFELTLSDHHNVLVRVKRSLCEINKASDALKNEASLRNNLSKLGQTDFQVESMLIKGNEWFAPASLVNEMRREACEQLTKARLDAWKPLTRALPDETLLPYPDPVDYRANVLNEQAIRFYRRYRCEITEPAVETGDVHREIALMQTKHCVRFALGLCLKDHLEAIKKDPSLKKLMRPDPLILKTGPNTYRATFDCKRCEMTLLGRVRSSVSLGHLPSIESRQK